MRGNARAVGGNESIVHDVKCISFGFERLEGRRNILFSPNLVWRDFEAERASSGLSLAALLHGCGIAGIKHDCQPAQTGNSLTQKFEPLAGNIGRLERQSSDVAARARKVRHEATADRIDRDCKHDGYIRGRLLECSDRASIRDNDIDLLPHELACNLGDALGASLRPAILDCDGATLDPTEFTQSLHKSSSPWTPERSVRAQKADRRQLLCEGTERPRCRSTAEKRDEITSSHRLPTAYGEDHTLPHW